MAELIKVQLANKERNYIRVYKDFFRCKLLNAKEKMVYIGLKDFLNYSDDSGEVFPSINTLASNCGMDRKTVISTLKSLEKKGVIKKEQRGLTKTNLYTLMDNPDMWKAGTVEQMQSIAETKISLSTEEMLEELKRRGAIQVIDKEKELDSHADQSNETSPKKNSKLSITYDTTTYTAISQAIVYSKELIIDKLNRENFVLNYPAEVKDYDHIIDILYDTLNSKTKKVKFSKEEEVSLEDFLTLPQLKQWDSCF